MAPGGATFGRLRRVGYTPPQEQLERYADLLVNYALGGGDGIKRGEFTTTVDRARRLPEPTSQNAQIPRWYKI